MFKVQILSDKSIVTSVVSMFMGKKKVPSSVWQKSTLYCTESVITSVTKVIPPLLMTCIKFFTSTILYRIFRSILRAGMTAI